MKSKSCVSSRDVAREAGVSQATVSYVLNNVKGIKIKPETREAVFCAVKKLNYHLNQIARGMKLNKSMSIGVVTDRNVTNHLFMKTLEGIKDGTQKNNYSITLMFNKHEEISDAEFIKYYRSNRLDGIIFAFASIDEMSINYLVENDIPFVVVNAHSTERDIFGVYTDHLQRMTDVIKFFKVRGAENIAYIGPNLGTLRDRRIEKFKEALMKNGLQVLDNNIVISTRDDDMILRAIASILSQEKRPQAIVAGTPRFSLLTVKYANTLNIKIPDELRIIALGSSNFYVVAQPSISAVELPLYDMGLCAASKLFDIFDGIEVEKNTILPSKLIIRDSS